MRKTGNGGGSGKDEARGAICCSRAATVSPVDPWTVHCYEEPMARAAGCPISSCAGPVVEYLNRHAPQPGLD